MKTIHKVLKISAKEAFKNLRNESPFLAEKGDHSIEVTRIFWDHINFSKRRPLKEIILRLAILPLLPKIISKGKIHYRKEKYIRFELVEKNITFVVICEKTAQKIILLSCFTANKKSPVSRTNANSSV